MKGVKKKGFEKIYALRPKPKYDSPIFHTYYIKLNRTLEFLQFVNKSSNKAFHSVFLEWQDEHTKTLASLDGKSKKEYDNITKRNNRKKIYSIKSSKVQNIIGKLTNQYFIHDNVPTFINESCMLYLDIAFEQFIRNILKLAFEKDPRILMQSNKELRISVIGKSKTYEEILDSAIQKEIDSIIEGGIDQINTHLKKYNLHLDKAKKWNKFREIFLRRNVLVHNRGYANKKYWDKLGKKTSKSRLKITDTYLANAINLVSEFAHIITDFFESNYTPKRIFSHKNPQVSVPLKGNTIY